MYVDRVDFCQLWGTGTGFWSVQGNIVYVLFWGTLAGCMWGAVEGSPTLLCLGNMNLGCSGRIRSTLLLGDMNLGPASVAVEKVHTCIHVYSGWISVSWGTGTCLWGCQ